MKRYLPILLLAAACTGVPDNLPATYGTPAQLDTENGFRGVQFGSGPDVLPNAQVEYQKGSRVDYVQDNNVVGEDSVGPLLYWRYRNGSLIRVDYSVPKNRIQPVLTEMRRRYGSESTNADTLIWQGERVTAKAYIDGPQSSLPVLMVKVYRH